MSALTESRLVFVDADGKPLAAGSVFIYQYNTTTLTTTFSDPAELVPSPANADGSLPLDASGTVQVFGTGQFTFVAVDMLGQTVPGASGVVQGLVSPAMQPVTQAATTAQALELLGGVLRTVDTIAALQALPAGDTPSLVYVKGYFSPTDGGEGTFWFNPTDHSSSDDGGRVIIQTATGARYVREIETGVLNCKAFGVFPGGSADVSTQLQRFLDTCAGGPAGYVAAGRYPILQTINFGDGTTAQISTKNNWTILWGGGGSAPDPLINPGDSSPSTGVILDWIGTPGGTMVQVNGPVIGCRWVGVLSLNGNDSAGAGFVALSFQECIWDGIAAYNWKNRGILLSTLQATNVLGNNVCVISAENQIGKLISFSPNMNAGGECIRFDGYRAVGGGDFTVSTVDLIRCGFSLNQGKGLVLGFCDGLRINSVINTAYGTVVGTPFSLVLDTTTLPFNAPQNVTIGFFSSGCAGFPAISGTADAATVVVEYYSMDDGEVVPIGVNGLEILRLSNTTVPQFDGLPIGLSGSKALMAGDGEGFLGLDAAALHVGSITRQNTATGAIMHLSSGHRMEFETHQGGSPGNNYDLFLDTAQLSPGNDDVVALGSLTNRYTTVYATTGSINTSDLALKNVRGELSEAELKAWARVRVKAYSWKDRTTNALHLGLVAQEVEEAFKAEGLDATDYGLLVKGEKGELGLRYSECWALEAAFGRMERTGLGERLAKLEAWAAKASAGVKG